MVTVYGSQRRAVVRIVLEGLKINMNERETKAMYILYVSISCGVLMMITMNCAPLTLRDYLLKQVHVGDSVS